jgi:hypothetical protein
MYCVAEATFCVGRRQTNFTLLLPYNLHHPTFSFFNHGPE